MEISANEVEFKTTTELGVLEELTAKELEDVMKEAGEADVDAVCVDEETVATAEEAEIGEVDPTREEELAEEEEEDVVDASTDLDFDFVCEGFTGIGTSVTVEKMVVVELSSITVRISLIAVSVISFVAAG